MQGDLRIVAAEDCGNAPKRLILKEFTVALAKHDTGYMEELMADDVRWNFIGQETINGKEQALRILGRKLDGSIDELHIKNVITHGKIGAVDAFLFYRDKKSYAICNVFQFTNTGKNAKIQEITSYVIKTINIL